MALPFGPPENISNIEDAQKWMSDLYNWVISPESSDGPNFLQSGTGASVKTVQNKLREIVSVNDFSSVQEALTYGAGKTVWCPGGTYTLAAGLTIPINTGLVGDGRAKTILDFSSVDPASPSLINCAGTISASLGGGLDAAVTAGDRTITLANSSHGLVAGDLIVLRNTADSSWNPGNAGWRQGEFLIVKSVSGAVITLSSAVIDGYADTCTVYKVTPTSTCLLGFTLLGNTSGTSNYPTIQIQYGRGNYIDDVFVSNPTATAIQIANSFAPVINNVETGKWLDDAGAIQASGVIMAGVQYGRCQNSILYGARHGASTGGGGIVVDRFNYFSKNYIASKHNYAADFHGNSEFCTYTENHIDGSVNYSGDKNRVIKNYIYPGPTITTMMNFEYVLSLDCVIEGNEFNLRGAGYVLDGNDTTDVNSDTTRNGNLIFRNNKIIDTYAGNASYIYLRNNGSTAQLRVSIIGNEILKTNTSYYGEMLAVSVVSGADFNRLNYFNNQHTNTGFGSISGVSRCQILGSAGYAPSSSSSPSFGANIRFDPSSFDFEKTLSLASAATKFDIITIGAQNKFVPTMVAARADTDITATNGDLFSVGVDADNRRVDFGAGDTAAADNKHAKNATLLFINSSERANQAVVGNEIISLMSVDGSTDAAALSNNIGGASQTLTVKIAGNMVGYLTAVP